MSATSLGLRERRLPSTGIDADELSTVRGCPPRSTSQPSERGGMPHRPFLVPPHLGAQFSTTQAIAEGVSKRRLRAQHLESPFRVKATEGSDDANADTVPYSERRRTRREVIDNMRAYATVMPDRSFFSGCSVAIACGLWIDHPDDLASRYSHPSALCVQGRLMGATSPLISHPFGIMTASSSRARHPAGPCSPATSAKLLAALDLVHVGSPSLLDRLPIGCGHAPARPRNSTSRSAAPMDGC